MVSLEELRSCRIFGISVFDLGGTILIAWFLAQYYRWNFWKTLVALLVLGEIAHFLTGQKTPVTKFIRSKI